MKKSSCEPGGRSLARKDTDRVPGRGGGVKRHGRETARYGGARKAGRRARKKTSACAVSALLRTRSVLGGASAAVYGAHYAGGLACPGRSVGPQGVLQSVRQKLRRSRTPQRFVRGLALLLDTMPTRRLQEVGRTFLRRGPW